MSIMATKNPMGLCIKFIGLVAIISLFFPLVASPLNAQEATSTESATPDVLIDGMAPAPTNHNFTSEKPDVVESLGVGDRVEGDFVVGPGKVELEIKPGTSKTVMM